MKKYARKLYTYLNEEYFDGILPMVSFKFENTIEYLAAVDTNGVMYFNSRPFLTYDVVELMLHEMCHVWQYITGGKDEHGKTFKEIALDISQRSGYTIQEFQDYFADATFLWETGNLELENYREIFKIIENNA